MLKIGILFGGTSREREISFAGGRTVYDNLNKSLFEAVPVFVDSLGNFILLDWQYVYKGTIRDFYPPVPSLPNSPNQFQVYIESLGELSRAEQDAIISQVGRRLTWEELPEIMDFAFLTLHGSLGEDGQIQGILEALRIPYAGSGIRPSSIGMDKGFQKKIMHHSNFPMPNFMVLEKRNWTGFKERGVFSLAQESIGYPMVIRPANQGSSIGITILREDQNSLTDFQKAIDKAFFEYNITAEEWRSKTAEERVRFVRDLTDIRDGIGFPLQIDGHILYHPEALLAFLNSHFEDKTRGLRLESFLTEHRVIIESFIKGKEFSCIVVRQEDGSVVALPPTEIVKGGELFDYRQKYLAGLARKVTPINLPDAQINAIRKACEELFNFFEFNVYARIDGFINDESTIYLNDPNTTSGMLPSSFFFHQAAEIGLNPSQFLTYIIRTSLYERVNTFCDVVPKWKRLMSQLDAAILELKTEKNLKKRIGVVLGGYSSERHISVESGRNIYEKLASSDKYTPIPIFLLGDENAYELWQIPINLLLKDNADDIRDKILTYKKHPIVEEIKTLCAPITGKYASSDLIFEPRQLALSSLKKEVDGVFIALHGRPGEDGNLQSHLEALRIPYNGSPSTSASITIDKFRTLQELKIAGLSVTEQFLLDKNTFLADTQKAIASIESRFQYPLIAKPVDDGCSSAVKKVKNSTQLLDYLTALFRDTEDIPQELRDKLGLKHKEEFPKKERVLIEALVTANGAKRFLEVTGGLLTHRRNGVLEYEMFEPSETLAEDEILSLEEKFLAGEGQNLTPARYAPDEASRMAISAQVKRDLELAARKLGVEGYARIDAFVRIDENNQAETLVIEVNSLPGMTPATCIFHQCALNGYKPYHFIDAILEYGFQRVQ